VVDNLWVWNIYEKILMGKLKYFEENLSHYHVMDHKSHVDWAGIEPRHQWWEVVS